jgi:DNA-binding LytR/AlgR family response regulator
MVFFLQSKSHWQQEQQRERFMGQEMNFDKESALEPIVPMNVLLIEDEMPAVKRLELLISQCRPDAVILGTCESISSAVRWLQTHPSPDLIFLDIHLADGQSFEIFNQVQVQSMVIFTTAYDQYALKAFKLNSIDYLLKPISAEELTLAFQKYDRIAGKSISFDSSLVSQLLNNLQSSTFRARFLVKQGNSLSYILVRDVRYCYAEESIVFARLPDGKKQHLDYTLEQLETVLDPSQFFRINRKIILNADAILKIHPYFNNRLKLELLPIAPFDVVVSREKVGAFKTWLDR